MITSNDMSLISVIQQKSNTPATIEAAQSAGALFGAVIQARGFISQSKKKRFSGISISPSMEKIIMLAETRHVAGIIQKAIKASGIDLSTMGAVFSSPVAQTSMVEGSVDLRHGLADNASKEDVPLQRNLRLITCVCQKDKADTIARAAVEAGSTAPVIYFGEGQGVRDRMGLLRIAVNPEKEIVNVITGDMEAYHIFDSMVEAGKLYTPGMGFIYILDMPCGYVNLHSTLSDSHTEATVEQMIKAIDDLKGTKNWRLSKEGFTSVKKPERPSLYDLVNLRIITRRGLGDDFVNAALAAGARGATRYYATIMGSEKLRSKTGMLINDEREVVDFHVSHEMADTLKTTFDGIIAETETMNTFILELDVPKALTYME